MARVKEPKWHEELAFFLPPQTPEERAILRQSMIDNGMIDPIVVSEEHGWTLDGYNRLDVNAELKLPYRTVAISCPTLEDAKIFMIQKQVGKRTLNPERMAHFRGELYNRTKKEIGCKLLDGQTDNLGGSTAEKLAETFKVSPSTIVRDGKFAEGLNVLPEEEKAKVLAGKSDKSMEDIRKAAPLFCRSCRIGTPKKDCKDCADLRGGKPKKKGSRKKAGSMKFDWPGLKKKTGEIVRSIDSVAKGYDCKNGQQHKKAIALMGDFVNHMRLWEKELSKGA